MSRFACCVVAAVVAAFAASPSYALHAGFVAMPELGHLYPLAAVAHAFVSLSDDHRVTMLTYDIGMKDCARSIAGSPRIECKAFTSASFHESLDEAFFEDFVTKPALETLSFIGDLGIELQMNVSEHIIAAFKDGKYDVVLADFAHVEVSIMAAELTNTPLGVLWPLVLQLPGVQRDPRIPAMGLALSLDMPWWQQMLNFAFNRVGTVMMYVKAAPFEGLRARLGMPPSNVMAPYRNHLMITPSIFGLDIAQPLYPNVIPAGMLQPPTADASDTTLAPDWKGWLDECQAKYGGVVYANMGSLGRLPPSWVATFDAALRSTSRGLDGAQQRCVLWKLQARQQAGLVSFGLDSAHAATERVSDWLPFSPRVLLEQGRISVFVTHCGDTSVYETVQYGAAFVGFALFADQPDMCARVADAKLGVALDKMSATSEDLRVGIAQALELEAVARVRMARLRMVSRLQGESRRAAEALALTAAFPDVMIDRVTDVWTGMETDSTVVFCVVFYGFLLLLWTLASCTVRRCVRCCVPRRK